MALMLVRSLFEAFKSHRDAARRWLDPNGRGYFGCGPHHNKMADALETLIAAHGYLITDGVYGGDVRFDVELAEKNGVPEYFWPEGARAEYEQEMADYYAAADAFDSPDVEWNDVTDIGTCFDAETRSNEERV